MTATTSHLGTRSARATAARIRPLALRAGRVLAFIGARWSALVDAGQFGPVAETSISRHTGARV